MEREKLPNTNEIFADSVSLVGIGANVSKLVLAKELSGDSTADILTVVLPTTALIQISDYLHQLLHNNKEFKENLLKQGESVVDIYKGL